MGKRKTVVATKFLITFLFKKKKKKIPPRRIQYAGDEDRSLTLNFISGGDRMGLPTGEEDTGMPPHTPPDKAHPVGLLGPVVTTGGWNGI